MQADSSNAVESGSTHRAWAETARTPASAAQPKATSSSAPSFVRRRSTSSSSLAPGRPGADRAEPGSSHRPRPEASLKSAGPRHPAASRGPEARTAGPLGAGAIDAAEEPEAYLPKLGRIHEERERERDATLSPKRSPSRSRSRDQARDRSSRRRVVPSEDVGINTGHVYRRGVRHRSGQSVQLQRQLTSIANASVLSVLSSLTAASSASSGSNSTITQKRYDSGHGYRKRRRRAGQRDSEGEDSAGGKHHPSVSRHRRSTTTTAMEDDRLSHSYPSYPTGETVSYAPPHWQPQVRPHSTTGYQDVVQARGSMRSATSGRRDSATHMDRTNSDSGISMRDTSPEAVEKLPKSSPVVRHDSVLEQDTEHEPDEPQKASSGSESEEEDEEGGEGVEPPIDVSQYQVASHDEDRHLREELYERQDEASSHMLQSPQPRRYHSFTRPRYDVQPGVHHMPYQDLHHAQPYLQRRGSMAGSQTFAQRGPYAHQPPPAGAAAFAYLDDDPSRETRIGYDLLASKLVEHAEEPRSAGQEAALAPLYRRFDVLSHRVLLHLQDELAELEEELRRVDEMIARQQGQSVHDDDDDDDVDDDADQDHAPGHADHRRAARPQRTPTSRRDEVSSGDELCERRSNILGRIYTRLKQYNKALASHRSAAAGFAPAAADEIERYRAWMDAHRPVVEAEAKFLSFGADLVALRPRGREAEELAGSAAAPGLHADAAPAGAPAAAANAAATVGGVAGSRRLAAIAALTCAPMVLFAAAPNAYAKAVVVLGAVLMSGLLACSGVEGLLPAVDGLFG